VNGFYRQTERLFRTRSEQPISALRDEEIRTAGWSFLNDRFGKTGRRFRARSE
jgi:hypothetical protein